VCAEKGCLREACDKVMCCKHWKRVMLVVLMMALAVFSILYSLVKGSISMAFGASSAGSHAARVWNRQPDQGHGWGCCSSQVHLFLKKKNSGSLSHYSPIQTYYPSHSLFLLLLFRFSDELRHLCRYSDVQMHYYNHDRPFAGEHAQKMVLLSRTMW